jgi:serine/threonine protein kinase
MTDATVERLNAALEGRYAIERELGQGGMATVYLADDLKHERKVALKVLKPELAAVVGAERFLAEIKVTANLQHPNILPLHDSGEADSFLFYVMPYVEGDTLKDRLVREGPLPVNDAVAIAKDIAEALQAAHEQGVIHRDIKPGNVLISRGKPLISDFGIALALSSAMDDTSEPERLASSDQSQYVASWSSEGVIAFLEGGDIWILPPDGSPAPFFTSEANDLDATFSSDGRWLAYRSTPDISAGRVPGQEVYVRPYPGPGPATLLSTDGGINPTWAPDDRQIFYRQTGGAGPPVLMAVDVTPGDEFRAGRPTPLIDPWLSGHSPVRGYDILPDGSFVTKTSVGSPPVEPERLRATELHVILNWTEELKARLPN